jgi:hypothetical protein
VTPSTESLIDGLADRLVPLRAKQLERRLAVAVAGGAVVVLSLVIGVVGLRPDLSSAPGDSDFWAKLAYTGVIAMVALAGARHLARPEVSNTNLAYFAVPVGALALLAIFELSQVSPDQRNALIFGISWRECPVYIAALALPLLAILLRLFAGFAPQRPQLTGGVIGIAAGGTTAMLYSLHCPETAMTFLLLWYTAGIAIVAAIGAIVGPRILRW